MEIITGRMAVVASLVAVLMSGFVEYSPPFRPGAHKWPVMTGVDILSPGSIPTAGRKNLLKYVAISGQGLCPACGTENILKNFQFIVKYLNSWGFVMPFVKSCARETINQDLPPAVRPLMYPS